MQTWSRYRASFNTLRDIAKNIGSSSRLAYQLGHI